MVPRLMLSASEPVREAECLTVVLLLARKTPAWARGQSLMKQSTQAQEFVNQSMKDTGNSKSPNLNHAKILEEIAEAFKGLIDSDQVKRKASLWRIIQNLYDCWISKPNKFLDSKEFLYPSSLPRSTQALEKKAYQYFFRITEECFKDYYGKNKSAVVKFDIKRETKELSGKKKKATAFYKLEVKYKGRTFLASADQELDELLEKDGVAVISRLDEPDWLGSYIEFMYDSNPEAGKKVCEHIDTEKVASKISESEDLAMVGSCIESIYRANPKAGKELWKHIEKERLAARISESEVPIGVRSCIESIYDADTDAGKELWKHINTQKLATNIFGSEDFIWITFFMEFMSHADPSAGKLFCEQMDTHKFAARISESEDLIGVGSCIEAICLANPSVGRQVCEDIDKEVLAARIFGSEDLLMVFACIESIYRANSDAGRELWKRIDKEDLAAKISESEDLMDVGSCTASIYRANFDEGKELWKHIDKEKLTAGIMESEKLIHIVSCIESICRANRDAGEELWNHIDKKNLASRIPELEDDPSEVNFRVKSIYEASPKVGKELSRLIRKRGKSKGQS